MDQATTTKGLDFEQALLSHLEMCYSVALTLTRNMSQALALTKDTLLWAWELDGEPRNAGAMKMALLSELRSRYLRDYKPSRDRAAACGQPLQEVGV